MAVASISATGGQEEGPPPLCKRPLACSACAAAMYTCVASIVEAVLRRRLAGPVSSCAIVRC
jgi:hypothetical protein